MRRVGAASASSGCCQDRSRRSRPHPGPWRAPAEPESLTAGQDDGDRYWAKETMNGLPGHRAARGVLLHGFRAKGTNIQLLLRHALRGRRRDERGQSRRMMKVGEDSVKFARRSPPRSHCTAAPMWSAGTQEAGERTEYAGADSVRSEAEATPASAMRCGWMRGSGKSDSEGEARNVSRQSRRKSNATARSRKEARFFRSSNRTRTVCILQRSTIIGYSDSAPRLGSQSCRCGY
jgi:hypothetical protein